MADGDAAVRYEGSDVHVGNVIFAAGLIAAGVVLAAALAWLLVELAAANPAGSGNASPLLVEGPRLQTAPATDLAAFRREKEERLTSYGWVDRPAGRVHIPVERAMDLLARPGARPARAGER